MRRLPRLVGLVVAVLSTACGSTIGDSVAMTDPSLLAGLPAATSGRTAGEELAPTGQPASIDRSAAPGPGPVGAPDAATRPGSPLSPSAACQVGPVPEGFDLDPFYRRACVVAGLPVVASGTVDPAALVAAGGVLAGMLQGRPDLVEELVARRFRLGVIGVDQRAVDLPEYRDLPRSYPRTDWDAARAYGATPGRPLAAVPEENLLCSARDSYPGQSVLTHELGHSVLDMAVIPRDPGFEGRVERAFEHATGLAVYRDTYAMTNADEYWAEGVQDFFDASRVGHGTSGGGDGYDGPIWSRDTLRAEDPMLYELVAEVFTEVDYRPSCPEA
jgi:hypothetical protein